MDRWLPLIFTVGLTFAAARALFIGRRRKLLHPAAAAQDSLLYWGFLLLMAPLAGWFIWQALAR